MSGVQLSSLLLGVAIGALAALAAYWAGYALAPRWERSRIRARARRRKGWL